MAKKKASKKAAPAKKGSNVVKRGANRASINKKVRAARKKNGTHDAW